MAATTLPALLDTGDHASRPAASAVGTGALYSCTDHALIYQSDGSTWSTWATLGGGGIAETLIDAAGDLITGSAADTAARLAAGTEGHVLTIASGVPAWAAPAAGGGGVEYAQDINQDGSSFATWTAHSGTWASDGTTINQTDTGANPRRAKYNTGVPLGYGWIFECEASVVATSGGLNRAGLLVGPYNAGNSLIVYLDIGADVVAVENDGSSLAHSWAMTLATSTYYKIRAIANGPVVSVYVDGTLVGNARSQISAGGDYTPGLYTYGASVKFRNIKLWTLRTNVPA